MKMRLPLVIAAFFLFGPVDGQAGNLLRAIDKPAVSAKALRVVESGEAVEPEAKKEEARAPAPIVIVPHRAIYKMTMTSLKNGSSISDVSGKMFFEWADSCDGWAVQQHLQLHFTCAEGDESEVNSTVITWESRDGKRYNFNVRRLTNGKETENYRGKATAGEQGGRGIYTIPKDKKDVLLPPGSLFPSAHTILILQKAEAGEKFFTRRVFDGSDEEGAADISAFIGEPAGAASLAETTTESGGNPLLAQPGWPVRLAFFSPESETGEPDYEMDLTLQANGIARSMQIDYGDFSVSGVLADLETLPSSGCSN